MLEHLDPRVRQIRNGWKHWVLILIERADEQSAKAFSASGILKIAEERLVESGWKVRMRIEAATDDAELEEQRQKDKVS